MAWCFSVHVQPCWIMKGEWLWHLTPCSCYCCRLLVLFCAALWNIVINHAFNQIEFRKENRFIGMKRTWNLFSFVYGPCMVNHRHIITEKFTHTKLNESLFHSSTPDQHSLVRQSTCSISCSSLPKRTGSLNNGWTDGRMPRTAAKQSTGCAPLAADTDRVGSLMRIGRIASGEQIFGDSYSVTWALHLQFTARDASFRTWSICPSMFR